jgi:hypothetical protein
MFFSQNVAELRQFYLDAWHKYQLKQTLSALEQQICQVLEQHPEYHSWLKENHLETQFHPELYGENPFLHMGLHLAIQEQVQTNRPIGIQELYLKVIQHVKNLTPHEIEHQMMEVLAKTLWDAQKNKVAPDENAYLLACRKIFDK